jgi:pSer/pThr/pTyr-binding forkhead associated (FHA) protein
VRLEVRYPDGVPHEVELQGTLVVLGRDPSCDLVLNDVKCSRRHAVIEAGPDGLAIRDTGSANGVFLNGQKVERSKLKEGDLVRLGDVSLVVLPEEVPGTVIMGPNEVTDVDATARPFPAPSARPVDPIPPDRTIVPPPLKTADPAEKTTPGTTPALPGTPAVSTSAAGPSRRRPAGVITLAVLWLLSAPTYAALGLASAAASHGVARGLVAAGGMLLAIVCLVIAVGLWTLKPWARIVHAGLGRRPGLRPPRQHPAGLLRRRDRRGPAVRRADVRHRPGGHGDPGRGALDRARHRHTDAPALAGGGAGRRSGRVH